MTVDFEKSPGLGLFGKSGAGKTTTLLLLGSILVAPRFTWWTVRTSSGSSNVLQRASGVSDVLSMLGYVVAQMEQREDSGKEGACQGRLGSGLGLRWGLTPLVAHR